MRAEIRSKLIESASYDEEGKFLCLYMTNGERREFGQVPKVIFEALITAKSPGQYYFNEIRHHFPMR
ncbi:KTSC domain-containing protein [Rhizobium terrae]|uniref:KTSC domain-containing protein n=1 Tax=Rhizobium terrae TaxID=2171756 RepID=UPI001D02A618|nr:KTSC domain-containing protein [Rhizobium terrae]